MSYYPPAGFHFKVEFPGIGKGDNDIRFQEVTGLTAGMEPEKLEAGGENRFAYRLPARATYSNLVLKRGMLNDSGLVNWFKDAIENFEFKPVDVNVYLLNEKHEILTTWIFMQAYPVKWAISNFNSRGNELVIETIELAYQYFRRQTNSFEINLSAAFEAMSAQLSLNAGISVSAGISAGLSASIDISLGISGGIGF
jgi:phage tail-like protein